jgi:phenylpropionate dioxygenase-like ring-hydroxylating dioxygenase large terminal subunit
MFKNFWYAIEFSKAITQQPTLITLMGKKLVVYRDSQGELVALDNRCAHRGASLAGGWVEGDCIRCPYHGWQYQADGSCTQIPANPATIPIPKRARVTAYPVQEKYGFVWVFIGDLPENQRPPLPVFPQFEHPAREPSQSAYTFNAHFTRTMENTLDVSHAPFMHRGSVGKSKTPENTVIEDYDLNVDEWRLSATLGIKINRINGPMRFFLKDNEDPWKQYIFAPPNITYSGVNFGRFKIESILAHIPVDENTTIVKSVNIRSFLNHVPLISSWLDRNTAQVGNRICMEDNVVVQTQLPRLAPFNNSTELMVASDATLIAYRRLLKQIADRGWVMEAS